MELLTPEAATALRSAPFTYADVGGTALLDAAPAGHRLLRRTTDVGCSFDEAVERLMTWGVHESAGLRALPGCSEPSRVSSGARDPTRGGLLVGM